ncbi:dynamin family protein [Compostimonas suwonensis]|uniref:Dynamin family protein n=1 Tax=Compostimonas suwonensis TaxID=1048394 RepID=A0A2M9BZK6_9MICO|nr:dynamin family protein [Compostimonas suwonensis]PJJ63490.1 dynamin family protein [Compostimonas suwonensis]
MEVAELLKLVDRASALARAGNRPDLERRLAQTRQRLLDASTRVIVVGEFKQGKSQLINALVNAPVCPVDDDIATSVPTAVRFGEVPSAVVMLSRTGSEPGGSEANVESRPVDLGELAELVSERGNPGNERQLLSAEVRLPRKILTGGLSLVDSPGVGGLDSAHSLTTLTALPTADAMLLVSDASQEYTEPEIQFLRQAMRICPNVGCVLSKTDLYPHWRQVAALDEAHLRDAGLDIPLFSTSSELRLKAARTGDGELNAESGFPDLVKYLRSEILGKAERLQRHSIAHDLRSTADHLRLSLQSELRAITNPEDTPQVVAELEAAKERADEMRRRSARWQVTLTDGMSDLISDMEHDLRDRMRSILRDAEQAIDAGDPSPVWEQFGDWLEQRIAAAVSDTFVWTNERAQWLSRQVAEHFARDEVPLPVVRVDNTDDVLDPVEVVPMLDAGELTVVQKMLIGMRGSYGGVLMIGLLTGIVGMSLINPFSIAAGVLIGGKAYREDKETRLKRRQTEAKTLVRHQIDDVVFQVGKQLKDRMRLVQRATRDHFTTIADERHRSLGESMLAAQRAASRFTLEGERRSAEIKAELVRVDALRKQASVLDSEPMQVATV